MSENRSLNALAFVFCSSRSESFLLFLQENVWRWKNRPILLSPLTLICGLSLKGLVSVSPRRDLRLIKQEKCVRTPGRGFTPLQTGVRSEFGWNWESAVWAPNTGLSALLREREKRQEVGEEGRKTDTSRIWSILIKFLIKKKKTCPSQNPFPGNSLVAACLEDTKFRAFPFGTLEPSEHFCISATEAPEHAPQSWVIALLLTRGPQLWRSGYQGLGGWIRIYTKALCPVLACLCLFSCKTLGSSLGFGGRRRQQRYPSRLEYTLF